MGHRRPGDRLLRVKVAQELGEVLREARGTPRLRRHGEVSDVKHPLVAIALAIGMVLTGVLVFTTGARAHEQETSVDWEVAYANIRVLAAPVYTHYTTQTLPLGGTRFAYSGVISSSGAYPTIPTSPDPGLATGDYLVITWSFRYIGGSALRRGLFWVTPLRLGFGAVGPVIKGGVGGAGPVRAGYAPPTLCECVCSLLPHSLP